MNTQNFIKIRTTLQYTRFYMLQASLAIIREHTIVQKRWTNTDCESFFIFIFYYFHHILLCFYLTYITAPEWL